MKYIKLIYLIFFFGLTGCSNDDEEPESYEWDCYPYIVLIDIQDTDGNSLFADEYHGIVSLDRVAPDITYTYKGETKPICLKNDHYEALNTPESRYYLAPFYGVYVYDGYFGDRQPRICFGEFDGTEDHNESVTLNWPDGTHSKIEFIAEAINFYGPDHFTKPCSKVSIDGGEWMEGKRMPVAKFVK